MQLLSMDPEGMEVCNDNGILTIGFTSSHSKSHKVEDAICIYHFKAFQHSYVIVRWKNNQ